MSNEPQVGMNKARSEKHEAFVEVLENLYQLESRLSTLSDRIQGVGATPTESKGELVQLGNLLSVLNNAPGCYQGSINKCNKSITEIESLLFDDSPEGKS